MSLPKRWTLTTPTARVMAGLLSGFVAFPTRDPPECVRAVLAQVCQNGKRPDRPATAGIKFLLAYVTGLANQQLLLHCHGATSTTSPYSHVWRLVNPDRCYSGKPRQMKTMTVNELVVVSSTDRESTFLPLSL